MSKAETADYNELIKELASAVSTQAQVTNRTWLWLMTVAVVALLPRTAIKTVNLPFGFGEVDATTFHIILFGMLVVLTIAFSSAYAQQFRAQMLAQSFVKLSLGSPEGYVGAHPRDRFDMLRLPTFNRVAPLAQLVLGEHQFYAQEGRSPKWRRVISILYYLLLKFASLIVYFGLPAFALFQSFKAASQVLPCGLRVNLAILAAILAALTLVHVCLLDLWTAFIKVVPQLWSGGRHIKRAA